VRPLGKSGVYATSSVNGKVISTLVSESITYQGGYFVASMIELKISATGSDYSSALNNLLNIATASSTLNPGYLPYSQTRTW